MNRLKSLMLAVLVALMAAFMTASCSGSTASQLDEVEGYMQQRPDSALSVLTAIPQESLRSDRLRARWSLLYAMALDKNWIDTTDVGVVMPAVEYYDRYRPLANRAKPHYYLGRIQFNGRNYEEAILSFTKAREYAAKLDDPRFKSLIFQALADTYGCAYLHEEAVAYSDSSYRYCLLAKDTMLANSSLFAVAKGYMNLSRYAEADSVFSLLLQDGKIYPQVYPRVLADYGLLQTVYKENYPLAVEYFEKALRSGQGLPHNNHWGAYAYCLSVMNDKDGAEKIFKSLEKAGQGDSYSYQAWKSRKAATDGDYEKAYSLLVRSSEKQTENTLKLLQQSSVKVQRDFYELRSASNKKESDQRRVIITLLLSFIVLLLLFLWLLINRYKEKIARQNSDYMEVLKEITDHNESLKQSIQVISEERDQISEQQDILKRNFFTIERKRFKELSDLCNSYFRKEGDLAEMNSISNEAKKYLNLIGIGKEKFSELESVVNVSFQNAMVCFRKEYPKHKERYYQVVCMIFAGFKTKTIALAINQTEQFVFMTKSRLKKEVIESNVPHKSLFLELIKV